MSKKIFLRADASHQIGWGHVARMEALGEILCPKFEVTLFTMTNLVSSLGFKIIEREEEFFKEIDPGTIVVLDGYDFDILYQKKIRKCGAKLVCLDDYQHIEYFADLVINPAPGLDQEQIAGQSYTKYLLGAKHALLREPFRPNHKRNYKQHFENIFLSFGGSDPLDLTSIYAERLANLKEVKSLEVVIGNAYEGRVKSMDLPKVKVRENLSALEMREVMRKNDLAIVPSSTILMECLSQNIPCISGFYVENQKNLYNGFEKLNVIGGVGDMTNFEASIDECLFSLEYWRDKISNMVKRCSRDYSELKSTFNNLLNE